MLQVPEKKIRPRHLVLAITSCRSSALEGPVVDWTFTGPFLRSFYATCFGFTLGTRWMLLASLSCASTTPMAAMLTMSSTEASR